MRTELHKQYALPRALTRREFLALALAVGFSAALKPVALHAAPKDAKARLAQLTGNNKLTKGRVTVTLPKITRLHDFVPIRVSVESPMTGSDYVKAVHIVSERNPEPDVASFFFTPDNGKAEVSTRIRLVKSQVVVVAAEMSDGNYYFAKGFTKVSKGTGGCG